MTPATRIEGPTAIVTLEGQFTFDSHRGLKDATHPLLENPGVSVIRLDLGQVTYMDSSSLGLLLLLREKASAKGKSVELHRPSAIVMRILDVVQFRQLFEITPA